MAEFEETNPSDYPPAMTATIPNLSSQYDAATTEAKWQQLWEEKEVFKANPEASGEPYCIVIPPPMSRVVCTWGTPLRVP